MARLVIYDKKNHKKRTSDLIEVDSNDLELFGHFSHGKDFLNIPSTKIGGKSILQWFALNDLSLWWFASPIIHPKYKEAMIFIKQLSSIIKEKEITSVDVKGSFDKLDIIEQICLLNKIEIKFSSIDYSKYTIKQKTKNSLKKSMYKKITKNKEKIRLDICKNFNPYKVPKNYVLVVSPGLYRRNALDPSGKIKKKEFFIEPFLDVLRTQNIPTLCMDLDYTFRGRGDVLKERLDSEFQWFPIEMIMTKPVSKITQKHLQNLKKLIGKFTQLDLKHIFNYEQISLEKFLKPTIDSLFLYPYFPYYLQMLENIRDFLKKTKPSVIIQVYEAGPYAKTIEIAAKELGIKTIGIQHGLIPSDYPDYIFQEIRSSEFVLGNPIPDLTLVYGPFYENLLTQTGNYPKNSVSSIGHPSFYDFKKIENFLSKNNIKNKNKLGDKKIILVPLSFRLLKNTPDRIILDNLFNSFKDSSNEIILVRPHPGDNLNQDSLHELYPSQNFICSTNSLLEDLHLSSIVVILPTSTVSTEAAFMEKPLILVDVFGKLQINDVYLSLLKYDVAIISSIKNLTEQINHIPKNTLWKHNENESRKNFMKLFFNYGEEIDLLNFLKQ